MASTYLSRTTGSPTLATKYTISFWVKRSKPGADMRMFNNYVDGNASGQLYFNATDQLNLYDVSGGSSAMALVTNRKFRDPNAFMHIVIAVDTTQSTSSDRAKIYINGTQETSLATSTYPSQNHSLSMQAVSASGQRRIGSHNGGGDYFDGCLAHLHYVDGTAYAASTFGETDSTSGIWKPKTAPSVTYGNNGEFLKFENSGAMGTDSSGNSNTYTVSGTMTQNTDTPTNNVCVFNRIANGGENLTMTNGNTTVYNNSNAWKSGYAGFAPSTGKWYWEGKKAGSSASMWIGIMDASMLDLTGNYKFTDNSRGYGYSAGGEKGNSGSETSWGNTLAQNDIVGVAIDLDNQKIYFSKNGTWENSGVPTSGSTGTGSMYDLASGYNYFPATALYSSSAGYEFNFGSGFFGTTAVASANADANGHGAFEYAVPSGYYALNTKNLKEFG